MRPDLSRDQHLAAVCGTGTGPAEWRRGQARHAVLVEQTEQLATGLDRLAEADRGDVARLADGIGCPDLGRVIRADTPWHQIAAFVRGLEMPDDQSQARAIRHLKREVAAVPWTALPADSAPVEMVGLVTAVRSEITRTRRLRELPIVAGSSRRPMLNSLRHWLETECPADYRGRTYCRYFVVTNGPRVPWDADPQRATRRFIRKISKLAHWAHERGVDFVFRAVEVTLNDQGGHVHANVAAVPRTAMGGKAWGKFLAGMEEQFGARIEDNGRVEDARELVKYVAKPAEVQAAILDHPDRDQRLRWLHRMHFRTRIAQPLGAFREHWRAIQEAKLKPCSIGKEIKLVPKAEKPKTLAEMLADSAVDAADEVFDGACTEVDCGKPDRRVPDYRGPDLRENVIIGHVLSNRANTPWAEPHVLVRRYTQDPQTEAGMLRLDQINRLAQAAAAAWAANGAPSPEVALGVAQAWRQAADDADASQVWALAQPQPRPSGVHKRHLTVPPAEAGEPRGPPPRPPPLPAVVMIDDQRRVVDPETGEIWGPADHLLPALAQGAAA